MRSVLSFVVTLLGVASAVPSSRSDSNFVHETRVSEPTHWIKARRLDSNKVLPMRFGLIQQNLHRLEEMLMSVSHPESPKYAQHFTPKEIVDTFAPSEETISAVTNWLVDSGFSRDRLRLSPNKGWVHLNASTSEVENLLHTEYHVYTHPSGDTQIGCCNYSLPRHLQRHVDHIQPTVHFNYRSVSNALLKRSGGLGQLSSSNSPKPEVSSPVSTTPSLQNCNIQITPNCLRALYNIDYTPRSTDNNTFGIVEFTPQAYLPSDLDMFFSEFSLSQVGVRPQAILIDGAVIETTADQNSLDESSIDIQYGMSLTNPQPVTLLQVGDLVEGGGFNNWLDAVDASYCGGDVSPMDGIYPDTALGGYDGLESCGIIKPPNVVSISYIRDEASIPFAYAQRQCQEYAKLGMLGTSVIYASGDYGVSGSSGCLSSSDANGTVFNPSFPSTCPFVTSVGATQMEPGSTVDDPEVAAINKILSGGGFSNIFTMPEYQTYAVGNYSQKYLNPSPFAPGQYNDSGNARAFPDISANGFNYVVVVDGNFTLLSGTSTSAPVVASIITLINDARITAGKNPVGFLNPVIYSPAFSSAFHDITSGNNNGCGTNGFNATPGWDPVTGVGTPNFQEFLSLLEGDYSTACRIVVECITRPLKSACSRTINSPRKLFPYIVKHSAFCKI